MTYILIGIAGFIIFHLVDIAAIKRLPLMKPATWTLGCGLVVLGMVMAAFTGEKLALPPWLVAVGWLVLLASLGQLLYSLFINLPFRQTYVDKGVADELITTGLYAIVRHPGVYGLGC
jgi:protein-S-isoprenylcysteine O-methyltransferase Ste14